MQWRWSVSCRPPTEKIGMLRGARARDVRGIFATGGRAVTARRAGRRRARVPVRAARRLLAPNLRWARRGA